MQQFLIFTVAGLSSAGIYAISASGLTLKYTTTGVFDWAHGATGMVAAFVYWQLRFQWGWPAPLSFAICLFVLAPMLGLVLQRFVMGHLRGTSEATSLVVTLALALLMIGVVQTIWDPSESRSSRPLFSGGVLDLGGVRLAHNDMIVLAIAAVVAVGLRLIMYRTRMGVAMRAAVDDPRLASLNGARPERSADASWILGTGLAVLAGILVAPTLSLSAVPLTLLIVNGYAAAVVGRLRSVPLTFVGALILGLSVGYAVGYLPQIETGSQYLRGVVGAIPAIVLFVALLVMRRPPLRTHRAVRFREVATMPTWRGTAGFSVGVMLLAVVLVTTLSRADLFASTGVWGLAIVGLSLVPLVGYSGRLSLCQLTLAAIGAIVVSHTGGSGNPMWLLLAGLVAGVVGVVIALPALRLSGVYLALATAAFAIIMGNWLFALPSFTVFGRDVAIWNTGTLTFTRFRIGSFTTDSSASYFIFGAVAFVLMALVVTAICRSRFGLRLLALKDSEAAYATLGLNRQAAILAVFGLSAVMAGIGGGIYGVALQSTASNRFDFFTGLSLLLVMVVGGLRVPASAVLAGLYLGSPVFTNLFPGVAPLSMLVIGIAGVTLGRDPNGLIPRITDHLGLFSRHRVVVTVFAVAALGVWIVMLVDVITSGAWFGITAALAVAAYVLARADDHRRSPDRSNAVVPSWHEIFTTVRLIVGSCLIAATIAVVLAVIGAVEPAVGATIAAAVLVSAFPVAVSESRARRRGIPQGTYDAIADTVPRPDALSAPVEALGLLTPFTRADVDFLDARLAIAGRGVGAGGPDGS